MLGKKGAGPLDMLVSGAIIVLIAIITISIGISVNENVKISLRGTATAVVNETTGTLSNTSATALGHPDVISINGLAIINVSGEGAKPLNAGNYSLTTSELSSSVILVYDGILIYEGNISNVNYTYYPHGADYNASAKGTTGLAAFADYWVSIVSILILVVIVGLFAYFGRAGGGGVDIR